MGPPAPPSPREVLKSLDFRSGLGVVGVWLDHAVNWEAISAIGRLVGAIAVVISLIYLASAVRSNTRATREASMRWVSDNYTRWIQQISGHPDLSELYYRGIHDFESLKGAELVRFSDATDLIDLRFPRRRQDIKPALIEMLGLGDQWIVIAERY